MLFYMHIVEERANPRRVGYLGTNCWSSCERELCHPWKSISNPRHTARILPASFAVRYDYVELFPRECDL